jgi:transposase
VQAARLAWSEAQPTMDVEKLVFIDETWAATNMTRSYGRAPKGCRCIDSAPLGDWQTTTFVAGLRHHKLTAPMVIDGPMDGELFLAWIEQFLCPTLQPGDIVILDNLSSHKVEGVQQAVAAVGAITLYLPPYSPDLNPIEKAWAKLKQLLRAAQARSKEALDLALTEALPRITPDNAKAWFRLAINGLQ